MSVCCTAGPTFSAGNGRRYHWLLPISCHFQDCKSASGHVRVMLIFFVDFVKVHGLYVLLVSQRVTFMTDVVCGAAPAYPHENKKIPFSHRPKSVA